MQPFYRKNDIALCYDWLKRFYFGKSRNMQVDRLIYILSIDYYIVNYREGVVHISLVVKQMYFSV